MEALEDTFNLPLCGLFLLYLSAMCVAAFSAVTVRYCLSHGTEVTINPIGVMV